MESVLDRERICARCKTKRAVIFFDREQVCAGCFLKLEAALVREGAADAKTARTR
jgi:hypothetical protein